MTLIATYFDSTREVVLSLQRGKRLFSALARRDLREEYVSHGFASWPILHPLIVMGVYLFVFTYVFPTRLTAPPNGANATVYLLAGIIPWITLSQAMGRSAKSVVNNSTIVKQVAIPLEFLPLKSLTGPLLSGGLLLACLAIYGGYVTGGKCLPAYLIGIPIVSVMTVLLLAGLALCLSAMQVFVRDLSEFINIFLSVGLFLHPILYLPDAIPVAVQPLLYLSPFTYLLYCWQDVLFYGAVMRPTAWIVTVGVTILVFVVGARMFMASKPHFGDFL